MSYQGLSILGMLANMEIIVLLIVLGFAFLFFRTLVSIINFPFRNSDSKLVWIVCLFLFWIPTMIVWWVGKNSR